MLLFPSHQARRLWTLGLAAGLLALSACHGTRPDPQPAPWNRAAALQPVSEPRATPPPSPSDPAPVSRPMPDLSGLAWIGGDTLLAVHDAKASPREAGAPRVTLFTWPRATSGSLRWRTLPVAWPDAHGPASDLESIARVPGTRQFILVESGANREPVAHLFLAVLDGGRLRIQSMLEWPVPVTNVEATAVARAGERLLFLYAERAEGRGHTDMGWAVLDRAALRGGRLRLGPFTTFSYQTDLEAGPGHRLVTALSVGPAGCLYAASAHDAGRDDGPFRSAVWQVGRVQTEAASAVRLFERPQRMGTLDGLKVESVAAQSRGDRISLVVGTDDEWLGAALRPLPLAPTCPP